MFKVIVIPMLLISETVLSRTVLVHYVTLVLFSDLFTRGSLVFSGGYDE